MTSLPNEIMLFPMLPGRLDRSRSDRRFHVIADKYRSVRRTNQRQPDYALHMNIGAPPKNVEVQQEPIGSLNRGSAT